MKYVRRLYTVVVEENNAVDFQNSLNSILAKAENVNPQTDIAYHPLSKYYAIVYLTVTVPKAENEEEEKLLKFGEHNCSECPYFMRSTDNRKKWHICTKDEKPVTEFHEACQAYYDILEEIEKEVKHVSGIKKEDAQKRLVCDGFGKFPQGEQVGNISQA